MGGRKISLARYHTLRQRVTRNLASLVPGVARPGCEWPGDHFCLTCREFNQVLMGRRDAVVEIPDMDGSPRTTDFLWMYMVASTEILKRGVRFSSDDSRTAIPKRTLDHLFGLNRQSQGDGDVLVHCSTPPSMVPGRDPVPIWAEEARSHGGKLVLAMASGPLHRAFVESHPEFLSIPWTPERRLVDEFFMGEKFRGLPDPEWDMKASAPGLDMADLYEYLALSHRRAFKSLLDFDPEGMIAGMGREALQGLLDSISMRVPLPK